MSGLIEIGIGLWFLMIASYMPKRWRDEWSFVFGVTGVICLLVGAIAGMVSA